MDFLALIFYFVIIIPCSIIHEYAHGWMADRLGDPTARYAGRLTLNPKVHVDLWGSLIMPIVLYGLSNGRFMFAYAKPVPYNPYNLKNQKWGPVMVGLAGPAANLILALMFAAVIKFFPGLSLVPYLVVIVYANVMLMVFNLLPIPPLDGSKLLYALLPDSAQQIKMFFDRYGMFVLIFFMFYGFRFIQPIIDWVLFLMLG